MELGPLRVVGGLREGSLVEVSGSKLGQVVDYDRDAAKFSITSVEGDSYEAPAGDVGVPAELKKPGQGGDAESFDIFKGPRTPVEHLIQELDTCILEKGVCVIRTSHSQDELSEAYACISSLGEDAKLSRLPEEVEEGYLGVGAKGKVVWLDSADAANVLPAVDKAESELVALAEAYQPYSMDTLGQLLAERSPTLASLSLHGSEEEEYPYPLADDKLLGDFLQIWRRSLLRAVLFLGPGAAEVTLTRRDDLPETSSLPVDVDELKINCVPNTLLVYRPSRFSYEVELPEEVLSMTACYLSPSPVFELMPYDGDARLLSDLATGPDPPKTEISVVATGTRLAGGLDDSEIFRWSLDVGTDLAIEIPATRYNVYDYWAPDPNDMPTEWWRTQLHRHQSFVEDVDLFDNKFFNIAALEAEAMSPMQRQVLECGADLLFQIGVSKKVADKNIHHAGVSVGLDKDDYPMMNIVTKGQAANVIALISNRFSFVFNLRGPNYVCDTACSAALVATHYARLGMLNTEFDPQDFHVAMGCHLLLKPRPGANPTFTKQGRCFTFDATADGYLPGEGTSGMILKNGKPEESQALLRSSGCGQNGRSATLTAPNGPAQEQLITRVLAEARMGPEEATAWECHGTGTSLGDPIEIGSVRRVMVKCERTEPLMFSSDKSNMGHMEGGAAMAGMIKCVFQVYSGLCLPTQHVRTLNPHMDLHQFEAIYMTETAGYYYLNGHSEISSFGFGGTNGHMIFWGESLTRIPDIKTAVMKKIRGMAPPEVRPLSTDPDQWDSDYWDASWKVDDKYSIPIDITAGMSSSINWVKVEDEEDLHEEMFAIMGNFNDWGEPESMLRGELPGVHVAFVTVPSDGYLEFRILVDGEADKILGPDSVKCTRKKPPVLGPSPDVETSWMVEGTEEQEIQIELFSMAGKKTVTWIKK